ncbi:MAG: peptide-methionine (S)-S-oxide reductase MsrA [Phycisphaerae bacterium]|nr:peptide-methionine (S)-S-oxide reductase MsrA [Phycisphaerae bacterium]
MDRQMAMFGAGCFWGVEAIFRKQDGVIDTAVGYAGGHTADPTYKDICTDQTGHAEVVRVEFDASVVSYETLVDLFFRLHDPTQLNRQGPDIGSQYRSVIFYYTEGQREIAQTVKARRESSGKHRRKIVTVIETAPTFYLAEDYHQQYFAKRGLENTCHVPSED